MRVLRWSSLVNPTLALLRERGLWIGCRYFFSSLFPLTPQEPRSYFVPFPPTWQTPSQEVWGESLSLTLQRRNLPQTCHHENMSAAGGGVCCFAGSEGSRRRWHQLHLLCFCPVKVSQSTTSTAHSLSCASKRKSVLWYFSQLQWCDFNTVSTVCVWPFPVVWTRQCPCAKSSIKKSLSGLRTWPEPSWSQPPTAPRWDKSKPNFQIPSARLFEQQIKLSGTHVPSKFLLLYFLILSFNSQLQNNFRRVWSLFNFKKKKKKTESQSGRNIWTSTWVLKIVLGVCLRKQMEQDSMTRLKCSILEMCSMKDKEFSQEFLHIRARNTKTKVYETLMLTAWSNITQNIILTWTWDQAVDLSRGEIFSRVWRTQISLKGHLDTTDSRPSEILKGFFGTI